MSPRKSREKRRKLRRKRANRKLRNFYKRKHAGEIGVDSRKAKRAARSSQAIRV